MNNQFTIRPAKPEEAGLVLEFIKKLAVYEKCADEVVADEATIYHSLFVEHAAEVVFAEEDGAVIGFALLKYLAKIAVERNCGRMEWICLDWNKPALTVYRSIGAVPMDEWTVQRLDETALRKFALED